MPIKKGLSFINVRKRLSQTFCGLPDSRDLEKTRQEIHDVIMSAFGMMYFLEPSPHMLSIHLPCSTVLSPIWSGRRAAYSLRVRTLRQIRRNSCHPQGRFFGGRLPSGNFGENAAWWWLTVLAFNLNTAMKSSAWGRPGRRKE